jgi:hypothetical protein
MKKRKIIKNLFSAYDEANYLCEARLEELAKRIWAGAGGGGQKRNARMGEERRYLLRLLLRLLA